MIAVGYPVMDFVVLVALTQLLFRRRAVSFALRAILVGTGALLLNATKVSEVQAVATAGERMPHKSTYFFPKVPTGLLFNPLL